MREWGTAAIAALVVTIASGCSAESGESAAADGRTELESMTELAPHQMIERVVEAYDRTVMSVELTRTVPEDEGSPYTYTFVASPAAWRVDLPVTERGDGEATLLAVDDQVCFDREFRPIVSRPVTDSYGLIEFDRRPWSCTAADFGLNRLATFDFEREDPRWRIESIPVEQPGYSAEVEELDGEPLVHVRLKGVTRDGPLDPTRPAYDLWIDEDHLPVRMETAGMRWDFEHDDDLVEVLAAPADDERGSYGYMNGPGHAVVKACVGNRATCPEIKVDLKWGDGRRS